MRQYTLRDGRFVNVFRPRADEAAEVLELTKKVGGETDFLLIDSGGVKATLEEEQDFLEDMYESMDSAMFVSTVGGVLVGLCSVNFHRSRRTAHVASIGISLLREYWGLGIGRAMMETIIAQAKLGGAHKLELEVRSDNARAIALYERMGFVRCGTKHDHIKVNGEYFGEDNMELML